MARFSLVVLAALGPLLLAGCGTSTVTLRNPESGVVVRCGDATGEDGQKRCIENFQSQGFEPVS
jgi:hypothetical protein